MEGEFPMPGAALCEANLLGKLAHKSLPLSILEPGSGDIRFGETVIRQIEKMKSMWQFGCESRARGLVGVWARANKAREEIFDAMMRSEFFATTGSLTVNLAVEAGQLFIVAVTMIALYALRHTCPDWTCSTICASSYAIGAVASMWLIERIWLRWIWWLVASHDDHAPPFLRLAAPVTRR